MPSMGTQKRALRASCDNCHQAKVKCVPTASGCQRCLSLNALCVHSPPGRSGRAPATSRESSGGHHVHQSLHAPTPPQSNPLGPLSDLSELSELSELSDLSEFNSLPNPRDSDDDEDTHTQGASSTVGYFSRIVENEARHIEPVHPLLSGWFSMSGSSVSPLHRADPGGNMAESSKLHAPTHGITTPIPGATSDFVMGAASTHSTTSTQSLPGTQPGHTVFGSNGHQSLCACFQSIIRTLEKIQRANIRLLGLDVALSQNKEALLRICNALKCVTPHDSTTRLVILLLLRKNLHLYHLLYQSRLRNRRDSNYNSPNPFSASPWSTLEPDMNISQASQRLDSTFLTGQTQEHTTQGGVARLTLGAYQLDDADETSLTKHILLLDVKKVPRLLERLDRRACGLDEADGLDLYNMMRSALIADFRAIMMDVEA